MIDPDDPPDTADPPPAEVRADGPKEGPKNEQFAGLNRFRRERTWVDVYLIGGTCLHGQIRSFDASMMLLQTRSGDIALYHHAISTIVRGQKRGGNARAKRKAGYDARAGGHEGRPPMRMPSAVERGLPRDVDRDEPDADASPRRAPVIVVKQRKTRSYVKPD